mgnify:CR=1 FL=1
MDKLTDEIVAKLGDIQLAYIIGDYAKGNDYRLIDLVLVGHVDNGQLE